MCHLKKRKKTLIISDTIQPIFIKFSPKWLHCGWPSNYSNRWPWKCRSCVNLQKIFIFDARVFPKNSKRQISLRVAGNQKMERVRIRQHHRQWPSFFTPKILLCFPPSPGRVENKKYYVSLRFLSIFKCFTNYNKGIWALQKIRDAKVGVFLFKVKNGWHGKSENFEYLWRYMPPIFFILLPCVWENNGVCPGRFDEWCSVSFEMCITVCIYIYIYIYIYMLYYIYIYISLSLFISILSILQIIWSQTNR